MSVKTYKVNYNFFEEYQSPDFTKKLNERKKYIKDRYGVKDDSLLLKEYFVEIFSWSVLPKNILNLIGNELNKNNINLIIDPCCGNAFHNYLFKEYLGKEVITVDIQDEPHSWIPIIEKEGLKFMEELNNNTFENSALLLSWIDYTSLTINLVKKYKGNFIISIGNYENVSSDYLIFLKKDYEIIKSFILEMPWGLTEKIEIYIKKQVE